MKKPLSDSDLHYLRCCVEGNNNDCFKGETPGTQGCLSNVYKICTDRTLDLNVKTTQDCRLFAEQYPQFKTGVYRTYCTADNMHEPVCRRWVLTDGRGKNDEQMKIYCANNPKDEICNCIKQFRITNSFCSSSSSKT